MKQKISVLCAVREDSVLRLLMQEMDDGEHCMFTIAHSGSQALRACEALSPDILVVDAVLPGLDGPALVDRMREKLGTGMPRVIGGAMMPFARAAFVRHGVTIRFFTVFTVDHFGPFCCTGCFFCNNRIIYIPAVSLRLDVFFFGFVTAGTVVEVPAINNTFDLLRFAGIFFPVVCMCFLLRLFFLWFFFLFGSVLDVSPCLD